MKYNRRIEQLSYMYSFVTGVSESQAKDIILKTPVGKAISKNNSRYLYEQQTSNLYQISKFLSPEEQKLFTKEKIGLSMNAMMEHPHDIPSLCFESKSQESKNALRSYNRKQSRTLLKKRNKNLMRVRRVIYNATKNADKKDQ